MDSVSPEVLQNQAARYVSGELTAPEREALEVVLEFQEELRQQVAALQEMVAGMVMAETLPAAAPASLKARIFGAVDSHVTKLLSKAGLSLIAIRRTPVFNGNRQEQVAGRPGSDRHTPQAQAIPSRHRQMHP